MQTWENAQCDKEKGALQPAQSPGRLVEGATVHGWKQALGALALHYPDRIVPTSTNHPEIYLHRYLDKLPC